MSAKLEEMLRIARAATPGPWRTTSHGAIKAKDREIARMGGGGIVCIPDEQHITTFNPRTAEALVKVAKAAEWALEDPLPGKRVQELRDALSALTAAMASEGGRSPTEGLSEPQASEEDSSNVG